MRMGLVASAVVLSLLVACSGEADDRAEPPPPPPPPAEVDELLAEVERTRPGVVLRDFVRAAAKGDERRMWERLSAPTRRRFGPSIAGFVRGAAPILRDELRAIGRRPELILSQAIAPPFAVAAVAGAGRVYAAALRQEGGLWRLELGSSVQVEPLRPKPGETVARRTQLAAEVRAGTPIIEAGLWLDGLAFPTRGGGPTASALTMFGETSGLRRGHHSVVAFASTSASATARAWAFRVGVR
jgi:hypothetical protein